MHGHLIKIIAKPGCRDELIEFLRWDAEVSRTEPGTLRFDVWDVPDEPDAVYLYETYVDEQAFEAHQQGAPYRKFVDVVVPRQIEDLVFLFRWAESVATNVG